MAVCGGEALLQSRAAALESRTQGGTQCLQPLPVRWAWVSRKGPGEARRDCDLSTWEKGKTVRSKPAWTTM